MSWRSIVSISSYESGQLEDPAVPGPDGIYQMTVDPEKAPDTPEELEIHFKQGRLLWLLGGQSLLP